MHDSPDPPFAIGSGAWFDAMLKRWLGPGATTGELGFEGRTLRIEGARLPLGSLRLEVERAELELGAGLPLGELPLAARLVSLRAVIHAGGVAVPIALTAGDPAAPSWFSGTVELGPRPAAPGAGALTASLDVTAAGFALASAAGTRVTVALGASGRAEGSRLTGRLVLADLVALGLPLGDFSVPHETMVELDLTAHGELEDLALRGGVFSASVVVGRRSRPSTAALRLENVRASVDVTRLRLRYQDLRGDAHGARFAGWGRVPFTARGWGRGAEGVPLAAVAVEGAGVALARAIAALAGAAIRVPADLAVSGELMLAPSLAVSGAFAVETPRTQLLFKLALAPDGRLVGSTLRGRLAAADAIAMGIFSGPVRPRPPAVLDVDAHLTGTLTRPGITGRAACARFLLDVSADASAPAFVIDDASVLLDVDAERIAWHRLRGRFYGGVLSSSGDAARASGLHAALAWGGVRVELLPTHASGESRLASLVHGASSGELRVDRHALGDAPLVAHGHLALADPLYLFTRALGPELDRYALPRVRSRGRGPLSARLYFQRGVLRIEPLAAAVDGIEVAGDVQIGLDGSLAGRVVVHLLEGYLGESALLAIPAAFAGRVSVPVELGGTVRAPEIRTDALEILAGLLAKNRVGDAVKSVVGGLRRAAPKRR